MQYRTDILSLYGELFAETHAALEKNAGVMDKVLSYFNPTRRTSNALARVLKTEGVPFAQRVAPEEMLRSPVLREMAADPKIMQQLEQEVPHVFSQYSRHPLATQWQELQRGYQAERMGRQQAELAVKKTKPGWGTAAAVGIPAAGVGGYMLAKPNQEAEDAKLRRTRNIAFGAGAATGLAAPYVVRGLGAIANKVGIGGNQGFMPEGYGY